MSICSLAENDPRLSVFSDVQGNLSDQDVATILETFDFYLRSSTSFDIQKVVTYMGYYVFITGGKGEFDFYNFLNTHYNARDIEINCINVRKLFPRSLSKGLFNDQVELPPEDEDEDATGFMEEVSDTTFKLVGNGLSCTISTTPLLLGRSKQYADCVISGSSNVSRKHCTVVAEGNHVIVEDQNTPNGTFINGVRLRPKGILNVGDTLTLADVNFVLN